MSWIYRSSVILRESGYGNIRWIGVSVGTTGSAGHGGARRKRVRRSGTGKHEDARTYIHRLTNTGTVHSSTFGSTNLWHPGRTVLPGHTTRILTGTMVGSKAQHSRKKSFSAPPALFAVESRKVWPHMMHSCIKPHALCVGILVRVLVLQERHR